MKKKGYLLQKTEKGQIVLVTGVFAMLFMAFFLFISLQIEMFRSTARDLEDAVTCANLAAAVIDIREFGTTHRLVIQDVEGAYQRYQMALKANLNLDDDFVCGRQERISSPVQIEEFIIYNVWQNQVRVSRFDQNGDLEEWQGELGAVFAPNGKQIQSSSVYSRIFCMIPNQFGGEIPANQDKLVDVVKMGNDL